MSRLASKMVEFKMKDIADKVEDLMTKYANEAVHKRLAHLELLAQAFIQETGLKPSEVELVEEQTPTGIRWYYRKREGV